MFFFLSFQQRILTTAVRSSSGNPSSGCFAWAARSQGLAIKKCAVAAILCCFSDFNIMNHAVVQHDYIHYILYQKEIISPSSNGTQIQDDTDSSIRSCCASKKSKGIGSVQEALEKLGAALGDAASVGLFVFLSLFFSSWSFTEKKKHMNLLGAHSHIVAHRRSNVYHHSFMNIKSWFWHNHRLGREHLQEAPTYIWSEKNMEKPADFPSNQSKFATMAGPRQLTRLRFWEPQQHWRLWKATDLDLVMKICWIWNGCWNHDWSQNER